MSEFPRLLYRHGVETRYVNTPEELAGALASGWYLRRAESIAPPSNADDAGEVDFAALNAADAIDVVDAAVDADSLDVLERHETDGKARKSVLAAIEKRRAALAAGGEQPDDEEADGEQD